ncbi:MAG: M23 family metallopeptidase, partial [Candidatus Micrarchaeota archaeon]
TCTFATLVNIYRLFRYTVEPIGFDYNVFLPEEQAFRCDACFSNDEYFGPLTAFNPPEKYFGGETPPPVPLGWNDPVCLDNRYDLAEAGEQCDFDPLVMRAIAWQLGINNMDLMLPVLPQMCGLWNIIAQDTLGGFYDELTGGMSTEEMGWFTIFMTLVEYDWSGGANNAYNNWLLQKDCPKPTEVEKYCSWMVIPTHSDCGTIAYEDFGNYPNEAVCESIPCPVVISINPLIVVNFYPDCELVCCSDNPNMLAQHPEYLPCCDVQSCFLSTNFCDFPWNDCNGPFIDDSCCGMEANEFPTYACNCTGAVAPGISSPFACQTLAKYQSVLETCSNNCSQGPGISPPVSPTGECPFTGGATICAFANPTSGTCTSPFCDNRITHWHGGIDVANAEGTDVRAAHAGRVAFAGPYGSAGNAVMIVGTSGDCNNVKTVYYHLRDGSITVNVGDNVASGQKIAEMGSTGRSTGPHLHFEIWADADDPNSRIDPAPIFGYSCPAP